MMRDKPHEESPGDGGSGKQCEEEEEQQHIALWKHLTILHSPEGRRSIYTCMFTGAPSCTVLCTAICHTQPTT